MKGITDYHSSDGVTFPSYVIEKLALCFEVVEFAGEFDPLRAQYFEFGELLEVIADEGSRYSIVKQLLFDIEDALV